MITYNKRFRLFAWTGPFEERHIPEKAGFKWNDTYNRWTTLSPFIALSCEDNGGFDKYAVEALKQYRLNMDLSRLKDDMFISREAPAPPGLKYLPFQKAGIDNLSRELFFNGSAYLSDDMGLGKTMQAIGVANLNGYSRLLIICPAFLRKNWEKELNKWHIKNPGIVLVQSKVTEIEPGKTHITSYELSGHCDKTKPEMIIVDEAHYLKTLGTKRTRLVLGSPDEKWPGLIHGKPTIFLSGTPLPNGKPNELFPILSRCRPDAIDELPYYRYIRRFCKLYVDGSGEVIITGAKRTIELSNRLRGSGFMTRRLFDDVKTDIPPLRNKLVVFPAEGSAIKKVLEKEKPFSVSEIQKNGVPVGSGLPEIRREMGLAKAPICAQYVKNMLEDGIQKVPVYCYHTDVIAALEKALRKFHPMIIQGSVSMNKRHQLVERFQNHRFARLLICQLKAGGEGLNLFAAHHLVIVEPSWTPADNKQIVARLRRIGQTRAVQVHYLVIEGSIDGKILVSSAEKQQDSDLILDKERG